VISLIKSLRSKTAVHKTSVSTLPALWDIRYEAGCLFVPLKDLRGPFPPDQPTELDAHGFLDDNLQTVDGGAQPAIKIPATANRGSPVTGHCEPGSVPTTTDYDPLMTTRFFGDSDWDVVIHADGWLFYVHSSVLSSSSSFFRGMFLLPQPPTQDPTLPIVDVYEPPEVWDLFMQLIYPGAMIQIPDVRTLGSLFTAADKYHIPKIWLGLRYRLKEFMPSDPFGVYLLACRCNFLEEAIEAAEMSTANSRNLRDYAEEARRVSDMNVIRFHRFVGSRESGGRLIIRDTDSWTPMGQWFFDCACNATLDHWDEARKQYDDSATTIETTFILNPHLRSQDLLQFVSHLIGSSFGCGAPIPLEDPGVRFFCPLQSTLIPASLHELARLLDFHRHRVRMENFGTGI